MKNVLKLFFICFPLLLQSQIKDLGYTGQSSDKKDMDVNIESPITSYKNDIRPKKEFNSTLLDIFFANKVSAAFSGFSDLSTQRFFGSLDTKDESFTIGFNFDDRSGDPLNQLDWVGSIGFKLKGKGGSSYFYKSDPNQGFVGSNVTALLKFSWIGNGWVNQFSEDNKIGFKDVWAKTFERNRKLIYEKIDKKVEEYNSKEYTYLKSYYSEIYEESVAKSKLEKDLKEKQKELYKEIADKEIEFIEKNKLYRSYVDWWTSVSVSLPMGKIDYNILSGTDLQPEKTEVDFYQFEANLSLNGLKSWSNGITVFGKLNYELKNSNNIILDEEKKSSFQSAFIDENSNIVFNDPIEAYDIEYKDFFNQSIKPEFVIFYNFFKSAKVGFSPSIEFNFGGDYDKTNWKLGLPVSLLDKKGKPKVNFELQWRETGGLSNTYHYLGVTTSVLLGDLL